MSTKWNPYTDFYSFLNGGLFNDGGDCYGFSSTAILYFKHYALGNLSDPYYPAPTISAAALPLPVVPYCLGGACWAEGNTLYQSTFPIYIHETYDPDVRQSLLFVDEQAQVNSLMQSIQSGIPVVMVLGPSDPHAVVAWGYARLPNGTLRIGISDPNFGNAPQYAYYTNGHFTYFGSFRWSTFKVMSPGMINWRWLPPLEIPATVTLSNSYYTYVFSSVPITIFSGSGRALFNTPGNSLSFSNSISGVVGFEEGGIQVYAIPKGLPYTWQDPGATSSRVLVIIPQNETSIVGYQLTSTSSVPLNMIVVPVNDRLNVTTSSGVNLSVTLFSIGEHNHSVLNVTSIPVAPSQTAVFSVPDWSKLNSTQSAASLQMFESNSTKPVTSYTLINGQQGLPKSAGLAAFFLPFAFVAVLAVIGILLFTYIRRRRLRRHHQSSV